MAGRLGPHLELLVAAALVGRVWDTYLVATLDGFGVETPARLLEHAAVDVGTNGPPSASSFSSRCGS